MFLNKAVKDNQLVSHALRPKIYFVILGSVCSDGGVSCGHMNLLTFVLRKISLRDHADATITWRFFCLFFFPQIIIEKISSYGGRTRLGRYRIYSFKRNFLSPAAWTNSDVTILLTFSVSFLTYRIETDVINNLNCGQDMDIGIHDWVMILFNIKSQFVFFTSVPKFWWNLRQCSQVVWIINIIQNNFDNRQSIREKRFIEIELQFWLKFSENSLNNIHGNNTTKQLSLKQLSLIARLEFSWRSWEVLGDL